MDDATRAAAPTVQTGLAAAIQEPAAPVESPSTSGGQPLFDYGIVAAFLLLFVVLSIASDDFLTKTNLLNVLEASAVVGIVAIAATLVIVAGEFDLSVGAVFALAGVVAAEIAVDGDPVLGLIAGVAAGAALGAFNGLLVTVGRVVSFIATLAAALVFRGIALVMSDGFRISPEDQAFTTLGRDGIGSVKFSVLIFIVVALIGGLILSRTSFGRYIYATGSSPTIARLSGVPVTGVRIGVFVFSGMAAAIAGVLVASRTAQASAEVGFGLELSVIAAVAIGGTSIRGGQGAVWRTVIGVLFLGLIGNGLNLLQVDLHYHRITEGVVLLVAVALGALGRRQRS
jgi:ribose transport system permease protein